MSDNLNGNEARVLEACIQAVEADNGEFCNSREVKVKGLTAAQVKGYLSQLSQKGYISLDVMESINTKTYTQLQVLKTLPPKETQLDAALDAVVAAHMARKPRQEMVQLHAEVTRCMAMLTDKEWDEYQRRAQSVDWVAIGKALGILKGKE